MDLDLISIKTEQLKKYSIPLNVVPAEFATFKK